MGQLILVRHGQASLGAADYDQLSELGRLQARATGARLAAADLTVERIVCGSLVRQRDTARELAAALGMATDRLDVDDRLDEYDHAGVLATQGGSSAFADATTPGARRALQSTLDEAIARWVAAGDGGGYPESHGSFVRRATAVLADLTA